MGVAGIVIVNTLFKEIAKPAPAKTISEARRHVAAHLVYGNLRDQARLILGKHR